MPDYTNPTITQLLADYKNYVLLPSSAVNYQNATRVLSCVFNTILNDPSSDNLNTVWDFFLSNQNGVVQENVALYGVGVLNKDDRAIYDLLYTMFRQATNGSPPGTIGTYISITARAPFITTYLQQAALTVLVGQQSIPSNPITPTVGMYGVTDGSFALSGIVGETISSSSSTAFTLTTGVTSNIIDMTLPPGDWDVSGVITFQPNDNTVVASEVAGISLISATISKDPIVGCYSQIGYPTFIGAPGVVNTLVTGTVQVNISADTPVYLVASAVFGTDILTAAGFVRARRMR